MKFFDIGGEAHGIIAIGQEATGVIAIGQSAVGIVAVGQMARGVVVVGQLAIGFFAVGQLALGLHTAIGMVGIAGRHGVGAVWKIFPKKTPKAGMFEPVIVGVDEIADGRKDAGWIEAELVASGDALEVRSGGRRADVELRPEVVAEAKSLVAVGRGRVRMRVGAEERIAGAASSYRDRAPTERVIEAFELEALPVPEHHKPEFWSGLGLRALAFLALCAGYYYTAGADVWNGLAPKTLHVPGGLFL
jgi:hypothetical protein